MRYLNCCIMGLTFIKVHDRNYDKSILIIKRMREVFLSVMILCMRLGHPAIQEMRGIG